MIHSNGKNQYKDNRFSFWEWSAPILQTPEEVMQKFHELRLQGRVVKDIIAVGMGYNWRENGIDDTVYNALDQLEPEEKAQIPNPDDFLPDGLKLGCFTELDEPLLIVFEDGDVLAISFDEGSCVRMDLNTVPVDIEPGINFKTFHAGRLFKEAIGKHIIAADVMSSTEEPEFTGSHGLTLEEQSAYIIRLELVLGDGRNERFRRRLCFEAWFDYGFVELTDYQRETILFPATDVPWIVEGYMKIEGELP